MKSAMLRFLALFLLITSGLAATKHPHNFMKNCHDWVFNSTEVAITASCRAGSGNEFCSILKLDRCYENRDGEVVPVKMGRLAETCSLWPKTGYTDLENFPVRCLSLTGGLVFSYINLNDHIGSQDGFLVCNNEVAFPV